MDGTPGEFLSYTHFFNQCLTLEVLIIKQIKGRAGTDGIPGEPG